MVDDTGAAAREVEIINPRIKMKAFNPAIVQPSSLDTKYIVIVKNLI
jgi:hypothetical protein